ncbi:hypothetical protein [Pleomorphomonas sp. PLEO]|uniref:hypothetical protein n=1 Tax=Pleomorphomonas sp. PLEO TaxID=3239306 RepID=UPI00351F2F49
MSDKDIAYRRLPILIGFTGKRQLRTGPEQNARALDEFTEHWCRIARWLDEQLPLTPKVLMCGGDSGCDLVVVRTILEGDFPLWSAMTIAAFDGYRPDEQETTDAYEKLRSENATRFSAVALRRLMKDKFDDSRLDSHLGRERMNYISDAISDEQKTHNKEFRDGHFDQLGLWLARYSTLLFAAGPAQPALIEDGAKPGAVARVVAFRRTALFDKMAQWAMDRSEELLTSSVLDDPDAGHVFWMDTDKLDAAQPLFTILPPITSIYNQHGKGQRRPDHDLDHVPLSLQREEVFRTPFVARPENSNLKPLTTGQMLDNALRVTRHFELFHERQLDYELRRDLFWRRQPAIFPFWKRWSARLVDNLLRGENPVAGAAPFEPSGNPAEFLANLRSSDAARHIPLNAQQSRLAATFRWVLRLMIALFLVAVACLEIFTELDNSHVLWLWAYVALVGGVWMIAIFTDKMEWAQQSEDLRGVKEVLRVQIAWWRAGIDRMVDRVHLRSIDSDLKTIREISATVTMWAALRSGLRASATTLHCFREALELAHRVRERWLEMPGPDKMAARPDLEAARDAITFSVESSRPLIEGVRRAHKSWVKEQASYHFDRWVLQRGHTWLAEQASSVGLGTALLCLLTLAVLVSHNGFESMLDAAHLYPTRAWLIPLAVWWFAIAVAANAFRYQFSGVWNGWGRHRDKLVDKTEDAVRSPREGKPEHEAATARFQRLERTSYRKRSWLAMGAHVLAGIYLLTFGFALFQPRGAVGATFWLAAVCAIVGTLALCFIESMEWQVKHWNVPHIGFWPRVAVIHVSWIALVGTLLLLSPTMMEISRFANPEHPMDFAEAFRALIITATTLLFAGSGMLKYYVEKRNHSAQFAESNDSNRVFLRLADVLEERLGELDKAWYAFSSAADPDAGLAAADTIYDVLIELRRLLVELGELALDENESWLQAHRERPVEAISGM